MQSACKLCLFNFSLPLKSKNCIVEGLKQLSPESSDAIQIFPVFSFTETADNSTVEVRNVAGFGVAVELSGSRGKIAYPIVIGPIHTPPSLSFRIG